MADYAGERAARLVVGAVVVVFLLFLFFGDRFGAISVGKHAPVHTSSIFS